jgi:hypothetical protein
LIDVVSGDHVDRPRRPIADPPCADSLRRPVYRPVYPGLKQRPPVCCPQQQGNSRASMAPPMISKAYRSKGNADGQSVLKAGQNVRRDVVAA